MHALKMLQIGNSWDELYILNLVVLVDSISDGPVEYFSYGYPANAKLFWFQDTKQNCILIHPLSNRPTNRQWSSWKQSIEATFLEITIKVLKSTKIWDKMSKCLWSFGLVSNFMYWQSEMRLKSVFTIFYWNTLNIETAVVLTHL